MYNFARIYGAKADAQGFYREQAPYLKLTSERASRKDNMKKKCTGWAIVTTMEREDGTWYTETITDIDDDTASSVDNFLTEYCENENQQAGKQ
jgi:hypothetical protein